MDSSKQAPGVMADLRKRAEERMDQREARLPDLTEIEIRKIVYELGTHQIELEMQNEELRLAQLGIAESRDRYAELYDFAPIGLVEVNQHGRISEANLTATQLLQLELDDVVMKNFVTLVHPADSDHFHIEFRKISQTMNAGSIEVRMVRAPAGFFHARLDIGAKRFNHKADSNRLVSICDISSEKQIEAERQRIQTQLQHSQRLESLGVMAGGIAHDFNNLLTCIKLHGSVIDDGLEANSTLKANSQQINMAVEQAAELCQQMLCFAGKSEFKQQAFDLSTALRNTTTLLRSSITRDIRLEIALAANSPRINGDITQIQQVVMNLAINACEASEQGGMVRIATSAVNAIDPSIANSEWNAPLAPGEYACIEVTDHGCGISTENIAKIYEPFYSTKFAGRGLGLSVVAGIVSRHKGAISIVSSEGSGTTFRVLFPAAATQTGSTPPDVVIRALDSRHPSPPGPFNHKSILVVDDEESVRSAMQAILKANHFETLFAENGEDAVEVFASHRNDISLILLDLTMPGLAIHETLTGIRAIQNDVPIVVMSGYSEDDVSRLLIDWDIVEFLQKPFENPANTIKRILRRVG